MGERDGTGESTRKTKETDVRVTVRLGARDSSIRTGIGFFNHILEGASFHGELGLVIEAAGDLHVDYHHLVEDVGLVLGRAIRAAIGPEPAIVRFGSSTVPMDDALALVAVDVSGRGGAFCDPALNQGRVRDFEASLVREFFHAFAREAGVTLHVRVLCGDDAHHRLEAAFKAFGMALRQALGPRSGGVPSTKGTLGGTL
jgi:imidazoleglycerol-phosphate dehydratase